MGIIKKWFRKSEDLKRQIHTLFIALRHPRTPWHTKALAMVVLGYALSPIDLIPDFIPLLGHVDDIILIPLGIYLVKKLVPPQVWEEASLKANSSQITGKIKKYVMVTIFTWLLFLIILILLIWYLVRS
jgi:uncharacterized membrane protein YkvA (DUF1232 family)